MLTVCFGGIVGLDVAFFSPSSNSPFSSYKYICELQNVFVQIKNTPVFLKLGNMLYFLPFLQPSFSSSLNFNFFNVFVQIYKCDCPNWQMYLSTFWNVFLPMGWDVACFSSSSNPIHLQNVFVQILKYISPNCKMYLSKW